MRFQSKLREEERKANLANLHNEELMLELALNKSKATTGHNITTLGQQQQQQQQTSNYLDSITAATMVPPTSMLTTTSNALPTFTADIASIRKGKL